MGRPKPALCFSCMAAPRSIRRSIPSPTCAGGGSLATSVRSTPMCRGVRICELSPGREIRRQALSAASGLDGRQRPFVERLLHADRSSTRATESGECQSGTSVTGLVWRQSPNDCSRRVASFPPRFAFPSISLIPTVRFGRARTPGFSAVTPILGCFAANPPRRTITFPSFNSAGRRPAPI